MKAAVTNKISIYVFAILSGVLVGLLFIGVANSKESTYLGLLPGKGPAIEDIEIPSADERGQDVRFWHFSEFGKVEYVRKGEVLKNNLSTFLSKENSQKVQQENFEDFWVGQFYVYLPQVRVVQNENNLVVKVPFVVDTRYSKKNLKNIIVDGTKEMVFSLEGPITENSLNITLTFIKSEPSQKIEKIGEKIWSWSRGERTGEAEQDFFIPVTASTVMTYLSSKDNLSYFIDRVLAAKRQGL